jgi:hypothetical protein
VGEEKSAERWLRVGRVSAKSPTSRKEREKWGTRQNYRKYLQPEGIDQIMLHERLNEICASINVQIRPFRHWYLPLARLGLV